MERGSRVDMRRLRASLGLLLGAFVVQGAPKSTCFTCHPVQSTPHAATGMANALQPAATAPILKVHAKLGFRQDPYTYSIERKGDDSIYRFSNARSQLQANIRWAFGLGTAGQTYLLERDGHWYESRVSYYKQIDNLDLTVGARPDVPSSQNEAIGRELSKKGAEECFHCHATGALAGRVLRTDKLTPGT